LNFISQKYTSSEKDDLKDVAAAKVKKITAELQAASSSDSNLLIPSNELRKASSPSRRRNTSNINIVLLIFVIVNIHPL
jgi:hypothetical protein